MPQITINGKAYETYVTVAQVDDYANGSLNAAAWEALLSDDKGRAVVMATRWIDSQCWQGAKVSDSQPLAWPRTINDVVIPVSPLIEQATILLAILTAANPELPDQMTGNVEASADGGTKRLKAGSVEIEYFRNLSFTVIGGIVSAFPKSVMNLIGTYLCALADTGVANAGSIAYGTCAESVVGVRDRWGVNRGF
ncbi:hypothetical protein EVC03_069 [Rhizobium phage RHph_Y5A]|nr:hypothetical protein EVC03_069 [Rhizobium phage RHph_Y5A]QIG75511.1 hypothetical protein EVC18_069 [Rhizobium phage RHph_Y2_4]